MNEPIKQLETLWAELPTCWLWAADDVDFTRCLSQQGQSWLRSA